MGNKIHPRIFRTGVIYSWNSKWFASKQDFAAMLREDLKIKNFLREKLKESSVDHIEVDRTPRALTITVHSAKPGFIIGRGGTGVEDLKKALRDLVGKGKGQGQSKEKLNLNLNIVEVSNPSLSAEIMLQSMIGDTERRLPFRRVLKQHLDRAQKAGAKGVKLQMKGRLNGAEIAREEKLAWGSVPLHNLRADIDYAYGFARTLFGTIGIKVWIYRGEVFDKDKNAQQAAAPQAVPMARPIAKPIARRMPARPAAPAKKA
ncbi:MAG TPA: 30S ribosomal protein S3 [Candidatus Eisenbacteria bacterium]|jgi:small subunit ribosomal protein S3|nr:30S ribosomal protein S3 [Candidatus Eisenbacteria bacterium]